MTTAAELVADLRSRRNELNIAGQRRFGITPNSEQLGLPMPYLRELGRRHRHNHELAQSLWGTAIHDARMVAAFVDDPALVTSAQMETWARDFDTWALVDSACGTLFCRTRFAESKAHAWSARRAEFVKRAGFAMMAMMAVHRKELPDEVFLKFLAPIEREATDERHFVKKGVNWALRQIGKRNPALRRRAIAAAKRIHQLDSSTARWIASDALRELKAGRA